MPGGSGVTVPGLVLGALPHAPTTSFMAKKTIATLIVRRLMAPPFTTSLQTANVDDVLASMPRQCVFKRTNRTQCKVTSTVTMER